mmetsp:Transcript_7281/g.10304  ORF Transcript_7281/g.10304 Transcript_7281/m.10304 type:complete len:271 (+) Transcript_7281:248-1060(+)
MTGVVRVQQHESSSDRARELLDKMKAKRESLHRVHSKLHHQQQHQHDRTTTHSFTPLETLLDSSLNDDSSIPTEIYTHQRRRRSRSSMTNDDDNNTTSTTSPSSCCSSITKPPLPKNHYHERYDLSNNPSSSNHIHNHNHNNNNTARARQILYDMKEQRESLTLAMKSVTLKRHRGGMTSPATTITKESSTTASSSSDCFSTESSRLLEQEDNYKPPSKELAQTQTTTTTTLMPFMDRMTCFQQNLCPDCWSGDSNVPMEERCEEGRFCL